MGPMISERAALAADIAANNLEQLALDLEASRGTRQDLRTILDDQVQVRGDLLRLMEVLPPELQNSASEHLLTLSDATACFVASKKWKRVASE